jgi:hypothetical protein
MVNLYCRDKKMQRTLDRDVEYRRLAREFVHANPGCSRKAIAESLGISESLLEHVSRGGIRGVRMVRIERRATYWPDP